ncbi:hypothetical protein DFH28DRAFT_951844, partial [Melampsora americana]
MEGDTGPAPAPAMEGDTGPAPGPAPAMKGDTGPDVGGGMGKTEGPMMADTPGPGTSGAEHSPMPEDKKNTGSPSGVRFGGQDSPPINQPQAGPGVEAMSKPHGASDKPIMTTESPMVNKGPGSGDMVNNEKVTASKVDYTVSGSTFEYTTESSPGGGQESSAPCTPCET